MTQIVNHWLSFIDMERGDLLEMASKKNEEEIKALDKQQNFINQTCMGSKFK